MTLPSRLCRLALILTLGAAACAQPRVITSITMSGDQAKMIYAQARTSNTGLIQCQVQGDGALVQCKKIGVSFDKPPRK